MITKENLIELSTAYGQAFGSAVTKIHPWEDWLGTLEKGISLSSDEEDLIILRARELLLEVGSQNSGTLWRQILTRPVPHTVHAVPKARDDERSQEVVAPPSEEETTVSTPRGKATKPKIEIRFEFSTTGST